MKHNLGYTAFIAVILLLCLVPSAGMFLADPAEAGGNEVLAGRPSLRDGEGQLNRAYLSQLSDYVEDNYFLRQRLVSAWSALNEKVLHTSISDSVLLGSGGWLYFADTLNDYTGAETLDDREIFCAARNLALMAEYCESLGARFVFAIAPNKNSVYPSHMPALPVFSQRRNAVALHSALTEEGVCFADFFTALAAQEETLYFVRDSHWNSKGAALAADTLNTALGRTSHYFDGSFTPSAEHKSDLYAMLYPTGEELDVDLAYSEPLSFTYDAPIRSAENLTIMTSSGGEGSLLMFRDSFGNLLYPYLADSFGAALFSRSVPYRLYLAAERGADCVVVELVERNLPDLLENVPLMPAPVRAVPEGGTVLEDVVSLRVEPSEELNGLVRISGTLPVTPQSAVFLCGEKSGYEAFLLADNGFGLYVPESLAAGGGLTLAFTTDGKPVRAAAG